MVYELHKGHLHQRVNEYTELRPVVAFYNFLTQDDFDKIHTDNIKTCDFPNKMSTDDQPTVFDVHQHYTDKF